VRVESRIGARKRGTTIRTFCVFLDRHHRHHRKKQTTHTIVTNAIFPKEISESTIKL
jgi:hypothetical protein